MVTDFKLKYAFVLTFVLLAGLVVAQAKTTARTPTENYILQKLTAGQVANVAEEFKNRERDLTLNASFLEDLLMNPAKFKIHRNGILIKGARVVGLLNLANTDIEPFVYLSDCEFDAVHFFQTLFKKGLTIDGATFKGPADFSYATVMEGLSADGVKFTNPGESVRFNNSKVKGSASFVRASFAGPVTFLYAFVDGPFYLTGAKFFCIENVPTPCEENEVSFNTMKINNGFFAGEAVFERSVNLINLSVADNFEANKITLHKKAIFSMMSVRHNVFLREATFRDTAWFINTNVAETMNLSQAKFQGDSVPQFENAKAGTLIIDQTEFRQPPNLGGLKYEYIHPTDRVLALIQNSESDYSAYMQLEKFLQSNGFTSQADEVFMEMKKYERRKGLNWFDSTKSYLSQALQGFGRRPQRVLYFDLGVLLIGAFIFRTRKMKLKQPAGTEDENNRPQPQNLPTYNAFLYSLTLFAPTIDTQYTNNWEPQPRHQRTRWYVQAHKVLGYILVPLTIAIWTGIFR